MHNDKEDHRPVRRTADALAVGRKFETEFGQWVISDLKLAKCRNEQLEPIILATVSTTLAFLQWHRRIALASNPTAGELAKAETAFAQVLLQSVVLALPRPKKRGRKKDLSSLSKFLRIWELRGEGNNWPQIEQAMAREGFGCAAPGTYKRLFGRHLPMTAKLFAKHIFPGISEDSILRALKGRPGRPPKSETTRKKHTKCAPTDLDLFYGG